MNYILDFDRTLFDTDRFKEALIRTGHGELEGHMSSLDVVNSAEFVFDDARAFFGIHDREDIFVVSSCLGRTAHWDMDFQREKIKRSGITGCVCEVHVVKASKTDAILSLGLTQGAVFVDDMLAHLEEVQRVMPQLEVVLIDRDDAPITRQSHPRYKVIAALTELDAILSAP